MSDEQACSKAIISSSLGIQNSWVPIEKYETEISIKKESASPSVNRTQFSTVNRFKFIILRSKFRTRCC